MFCQRKNVSFQSRHLFLLLKCPLLRKSLENVDIFGIERKAVRNASSCLIFQSIYCSNCRVFMVWSVLFENRITPRALHKIVDLIKVGLNCRIRVFLWIQTKPHPSDSCIHHSCEIWNCITRGLKALCDTVPDFTLVMNTPVWGMWLSLYIHTFLVYIITISTFG